MQMIRWIPGNLLAERRNRFRAALALGLALALIGAVGAAAAPRPLDPGTRFFVPAPSTGALPQALGLLRAGDVRDALLIAAMEATPRAVWLTQGTPADVRTEVRRTVAEAQVERAVPVLVAYNVPGRDCGGFSAGGAQTTAAYEAWIDGIAAGIGSRKAIVILEPDGLANIDCLTAAQQADRFAQLNYAVDALEALPATNVYLDAGHSHWQSVGTMAQRLVQAGVQRAQGFFLDVSNYQPTPQQLQYGTWISKCIWFANNPAEGGWRLGHYDYCASQYYPANADDFSTWHLTDEWYAANVDNAANPPSGPSVLTHFVVDTSRNGQGAWHPTAAYPDAQDWCNPPGRGLGARPTANTGNALADAFLWIKVPGESDGSCNRGIAGSTTDPEWGGIVDPAAGAWFPQQALQLAQLASPPLIR